MYLPVHFEERLVRAVSFLRGQVSMLLLAVLAAACSSASVRGDTIALEFSGGTSGSLGNARTLGWQFTTALSIDVTALGIWDGGASGLTNSHQVGIFDTSSTLLATTTIPSGTPGFVDGTSNFRFVGITPVTLSAGTYRIGATYLGQDADQHTMNGANTMAAGITFDGGRFNIGAGLNDPTNATGTNFFGPNFEFNPTSATIPEPSSLALLSLGGVAAAFIRRRRKASSDTEPSQNDQTSVL